jgi:uncharacterized protein (DUF1697 family)
LSPGVQYLALLRGVNVGGNNLVKMADLRAAVESMGFADVATYIASGNLLFRAPRRPREELAAALESELTSRLRIDARLVLLSAAQLKAVVDGAPEGFGGDAHRWDVVFVRRPLTAAKAFGVMELREGVDRAWPGPGVVYFSRLTARATSSRLGKVILLPEYANMTIRSWSTTAKLLALIQSRAGR